MTATGDAPATRKDLLEFMEHMTRALDTMRMDMIREVEEKLDVRISESEHRMLLSMEQLRHDMIETHKDTRLRPSSRISSRDFAAAGIS